MYHVSGPSSASSLTVNILEEGTASSESWKCYLLYFVSCLCLHHVDGQAGQH